MSNFFLGFCILGYLLILVSGDPFRRKPPSERDNASNVTEVYQQELSIIQTPDTSCPWGQKRDRLGRCRTVYKRSIEDIEDCGDDCREEPKCSVGEELDERTGECREIAKCDDGPCTEPVMEKMKESPKARSKKGWHVALILKKKKKLMKPFLKPKPKPHHPPHHDDHHHHTTPEPEPEEEAPGPEDAPEPEGLRLFNDEICVEKEDGTTGNCIGSAEVPEISGVNRRASGSASTDKEQPAVVKKKEAADTDVKRKVIRFLKVLRMRQRLSPRLGMILQNPSESATDSVDDKLRR
ncbi:UNVERIFIED_CONTAM: hypothetical protein PYX00_005113 [Menopon gallinae]|uniref:Uncharacterized protein n=1 Tax=Menopon gallinae TaxID=328185 RepID=A0AAW2HQE0_9NEOP